MFPSNTACISKNYLHPSNPKTGPIVLFIVERYVYLSTFFYYLEVESASTVTFAVELAVDSAVASALAAVVAFSVAFGFCFIN